MYGTGGTGATRKGPSQRPRPYEAGTGYRGAEIGKGPRASARGGDRVELTEIRLTQRTGDYNASAPQHPGLPYWVKSVGLIWTRTLGARSNTHLLHMVYTLNSR
jgi:hypothetical protein